MTVIVTGAAGFVGSHTVDKLLAEGHAVIGVDNLRTGRLDNLKQASASPKFKLEKMDITEPGRLDAIVGLVKPQAIIHLAALVSVPESIANPALNQLLNVDATRLVAEAAARYQVQRVVFASSAAVYGDCDQLPLQESAPKQPLSPYGEAKLLSEKILLDAAREHAFTAVCLRYFNIYGLRQDVNSPYSGVISIFNKRFAAGESITVFGDGGQTRDFIHVSDVARANVMAVTAPGLQSGSHNICTGQPTTLKQIVQIFRDSFPQSPVPKHAPARGGDIRESLGNPSSARNALGFEYKTNIRKGLSEFIAASIPGIIAGQQAA